jgi:hypothetical protein
MIIAILPVAILLWLIGWALSSVGHKSKSQKTQTTTERETVKIVTMIDKESDDERVLSYE